MRWNSVLENLLHYEELFIYTVNAFIIPCRLALKLGCASWGYCSLAPPHFPFKQHTREWKFINLSVTNVKAANFYLCFLNSTPFQKFRFALWLVGYLSCIFCLFIGFWMGDTFHILLCFILTNCNGILHMVILNGYLSNEWLLRWRGCSGKIPLVSLGLGAFICLKAHNYEPYLN